MPGTTAMDDLLRELTARREAQGRGREDLQKWISDLDVLVDQVDEWLQPLRVAGLLEVERHTFKVHEIDHGEYEAPGLSMTFPGSGRYVSVEPRGLGIAGAVLGEGMVVSGMRGRADMASASGDRVAIFRDGQSNWWFVGTLPGRSGVQHPVNEDTFAVTLQWLLP